MGKFALPFLYEQLCYRIWQYICIMIFTVWLYVLANKCIDNGSCVNGTCQNVPIDENDRGYICACEPGYIGQDCENSNLLNLNSTLIKQQL